jgi:5-methyltetrahydrofolate--homocysteine methyltransferase
VNWLCSKKRAKGFRQWRTTIKTLVADGAWGTELFKLGLKSGKCPEEWNISHPVVVRKIAENYIAAGSDIVMTNTFGANRFQLENHGLSGKIKEINKIGAALSREACGEKAICAASMGPSGKLFIMGEASQEELFEAFCEQAQALKDGGADWLVVETMTDVGEMEIAVRAAAATGLPVVASMTYEQKPSGYHTVMGHTPRDAVAAAVKAGASYIGANCGCGIDTYIELVFILRNLTALPLWIKANAGLPQLVEGKPVYQMTSDIYASHVVKILDAEVNVIGGCCGTDPQFIRKIRSVVDIWNIGHV